MCSALTPALLREQDVALHAQTRQLLVERTHLGANVRDPQLQLSVLETGQVVWH